jgi:hypothetical protein
MFSKSGLGPRSQAPSSGTVGDIFLGRKPVFGELFKTMAGVDLITVHYRGAGPA